MTAKEFAVQLVDKFYIGLDLKDYRKARNCAIFTANQRIQETMSLDRIRFLKDVIIEIEKL